MKFFSSKKQETGEPIRKGIEQYIQQRCREQQPQILPVDFFAELLKQLQPTQQQVDGIINSILKRRNSQKLESNIYKLLGKHNLNESNINLLVEEYNCKIIQTIPKMATESILIIQDNLGDCYEIKLKTL